MNKSNQSRLSLLIEIEALETRLKDSQLRLEEANSHLAELKENLEEQLNSEELLGEISAGFVNLPADRIDSEVEKAQRSICELMNLDRSTLWKVIDGEPGTILLTHIYQPSGNPVPPENMNLNDFWPWSIQKILGGETLTITKMTDLPPEAARDLESFRQYKTKSTVLLPLSIGEGPVFGLLTFSVLGEERDWTKAVVKKFTLISQVFANAIARKRSDRALIDSEERLKISTDAAGAGLWDMEIDTKQVWVTPKTRELFHFAPDEKLNINSFFNTIHPDDHEQVQQDVQQAMQSGEGLLSEFRILLPDGSIRWIMARGQLHLGSDKNPGRLMGVSIDITKSKQAEQDLKERLEFEALLAEISMRFVNLPTHRIDREIQDTERRICELLDLDLAAFWQWPPDTPDILTLTHLYTAQGSSQPSDQVKLIENFPWVMQQMQAGRIVALSSIEELPAEAVRDLESARLSGIKSNLTLPLSVGGDQLVGALGLNTTRKERDWPDELVKWLQLIAQVFANALARKQMEVQLQKRFREIETLKQQLENENIYLREEVRHLVEHADIVGQSAVMKKVLASAEHVAGTDATVLVLGETGTGKELLARAIHRMSLRKDRPLIKVNCAALPPMLIESELFGREKGAYTGATTMMAGRFEIADGSTLFLDEIGELSIDLQSKLLRVLEEGAFERLGSTKTLQVDVRIIAATNRDLRQEIKEGKFREDLFYRLNVFPIIIPPLRDRPEDTPLLVRTVVKEFQKKLGKKIDHIPKKTLKFLQAYSWPGNVRELRNMIERAMILSEEKTLHINLPDIESSEADAAESFENMARRHIISTLNKTGWRIAGRGGAAEILGLKRATLQSKMKKLDIKRPNQARP